MKTLVHIGLLLSGLIQTFIFIHIFHKLLAKISTQQLSHKIWQ